MKAKISKLEDLPAILTIPQIQEILGISRVMAYELAHRAGFPAIRLGRCLRVPRAALEAWLSKQAGGGNGGK